jgi:glycosyltransferase involved in cell wall biosynthesis
MEPLVTILLPVYNGGNYLKIAIESILNQTYTDFELLIIDDGSTDDSVRTISSYSDPRIRLVKNEKNMGIVKTLNRGIQLAEGSFIARMDADDICLPSRIEKQAQYLTEHPEVSMVDSIMEIIDENGKSLNKTNSPAITDEEVLRTMARINCMGHSSIMMRKDDYVKYLYRPIYYEDDDLWLRLLNDGKKIHKVAEPLLLYRVHNQSIIQSDKQSNTSFKKFITTRWFYYSNLRFTDKLKLFNLKVLFWIIVYFGVLQYKKLKG